MFRTANDAIRKQNRKIEKPNKTSDLKRYMWVIARLGGWKGCLSERKTGITTFWNVL